jgi:hypothetical protein
MQADQTRKLIRNLGIELIVYGALVTTYLVIATRWLGRPLARLFDDNLVAYAFVSLGLMLAQGIALDLITSFLLNQLHLERPEQEVRR